MDLYWSVFGWFILLTILDLILIAAAGLVLAFALGAWDIQQLYVRVAAYPYLAFAANIANYILLALTLSVVIRIYLFRSMWEYIAISSTVHNLEAADNVQARGDAVSALGEGFADSLDIGGL